MKARTWIVTLTLAACGAAMAAPDGHRDHDRGGSRDASSHRDVRDVRDNGNHREHREHRDGRWYDGANGHNHYYPGMGMVVPVPPRVAPPIFWGGVHYRFWDGVWLSSGPRGWVSVRPPLGIVVADLPSFRTAVVIAGITYLYANGVYYRERGEGGYEVVPPPTAQPDPAPVDKTFVYPRQGQSAQQQASEEYECHRWAVTQSGFDPTGAATGQSASTSATRRNDYQRARTACLEGRGYTVR